MKLEIELNYFFYFFIFFIVYKIYVKFFKGVSLAKPAKFRDVSELKSGYDSNKEGSSIDEKRDLPSYSPANGKFISSEKCYSEEDVKEVVKRSRIAWESWKKTSFSERRAVLRDLMDLILKEQKKICQQSCHGTGKTIMEATYGEILTTLEKMRWTMNTGERYLTPRDRKVPGLLFLKKARVEYYPLGVIGIIIPGNYPFHNIASAVTTAIFSGNGAVVKVSEWANSSRKYFENIFRRVLFRRGHNPDLVSLIGGYGQTGAALIDAPCDHILFIGSPQTGKLVMQSAVKSLTPVTLELGGKDPFVVFDDAEFDHAIDVALRAVFTNCGQNCIASERIYVHKSIFDRFSKEIANRVSKLRQGDSLDGKDYDIGSIAMPRQVEIVEELIEDAVKKGAKILTGGKRNSSLNELYENKNKNENVKCSKCLFFEPTVLSNVDHSMNVVNHEAFGPIMLLLPFETEDELIQKVNSTPFALGCSIFSTNYQRAERVAKKIRSGMCVINDFGISYLIQTLPFGGVKLSGFGRFNGKEGLRAFTRLKSVVTDRFPIRTKAPSFVKYPIPSNGVSIVSNALHMVYSRKFSNQIKGFFQMIKSIISKK